MQLISVIGAGTMGNGIAHVFAQAGYSVILIDQQQTALDRAKATIARNLDRQVAKGLLDDNTSEAIKTRITYVDSDLTQAANADLIVEAIVEKLEIKQALFKELDSICKTETILASNTSSISITALAAVTKRPDKVMGMHFMNPVPVMKLVELIKGYSTSQSTVVAITQAVEKMNKIPVVVNDYPGFVANRILMPMINEAIQSLFEGVAGVNEIDEVMKLGMAHPMGPLLLADFIGLDVCHNILLVLFDGFKNPKYAPCPLLVNMVRAGKLGAKTGEGFYTWDEKGKASGISSMFSQTFTKNLEMAN